MTMKGEGESRGVISQLNELKMIPGTADPQDRCLGLFVRRLEELIRVNNRPRRADHRALRSSIVFLFRS